MYGYPTGRFIVYVGLWRASLRPPFAVDATRAQHLAHPFFGVAGPLLDFDRSYAVLRSLHHGRMQRVASRLGAFPRGFDATFSCTLRSGDTRHGLPVVAYGGIEIHGSSVAIARLAQIDLPVIWPKRGVAHLALCRYRSVWGVADRPVYRPSRPFHNIGTEDTGMSGPHTEDPKMFESSYLRDRAIAELLAFGAVDVDTAGTLLRIWKHRNRLSTSDRGAVLDWFRDNPVEPPYAIIDQGIGGWASGACADPSDDDDSTEPVNAPINALTF